ncbi:MAG: hypothetical protein IJ347_01290 [Faecalibacterium sp.]|nr:hypothetical protein [Faecalibacterium sp.]
MARTVVKIYGDGEFWVDGQKRAKLYPDGEIYADGRKVGRVYPDGDIYIDGKCAGKVYSDGEVWVGGQKVATGVYLLDLLEGSGGADSTSGRDDSNGSPKFGGFGGGTKLDDRVEVGGSSFGCGVLFVIVLLIVASIYAFFKLWTSELPQLLFSNMNTLGPVATVAVYAGMLFMIYYHCCQSTQEKDVQFVRGMLQQAGVFFANVIVFTVLDLIVTALSYGFTLGDVLTAAGSALAGSVFGMILIAVFIGAAPTIVSSILSLICIKKGVVLRLPQDIRWKAPRGKAPRVKAPSSKTPSYKVPSSKTPSSCKPTRTVSVAERCSWVADWAGQNLGVKAMCVCFLLVLVLATAGLPASLYVGVDFSYLTAQDWLMPVVGIVAGVLIRRNMWRSRRTFVKEWLIQSGMQYAVCLLNCAIKYGLDSIIYAPDMLLDMGGILLFVGALIALFTKPFVP